MRTFFLALGLVLVSSTLVGADIPVTCLLETSIFTPELNAKIAATGDHSKLLVNREKTGLGNDFLQSIVCWNDQTGDFVGASFDRLLANSTPQVATVVERDAQPGKGTVTRQPAGASADRWWVSKGDRTILMVAAARNPISKAYLNIQFGYYNPAGWAPNTVVQDRIPTDAETKSALAHLGVGDPLPAQTPRVVAKKPRSEAVTISSASQWVEVAAGTALSEGWRQQLAREVVNGMINTSRSKCWSAGWEEAYLYTKPPQLVCEVKTYTQPQYSLSAFASDGIGSAFAGASMLGGGYAGISSGQPAGASAGISVVGYKYYQAFSCSTYFECGYKE